MLGEKGFNEIDLALFNHLLYNKKNLCFVRTQCDTQINGLLDDFEMNTEESDITAEIAFQMLQEDFRLYMKNEALSKMNHSMGWFLRWIFKRWFNAYIALQFARIFLFF